MLHFRFDSAKLRKLEAEIEPFENTAALELIADELEIPRPRKERSGDPILATSNTVLGTQEKHGENASDIAGSSSLERLRSSL